MEIRLAKALTESLPLAFIGVLFFLIGLEIYIDRPYSDWRFGTVSYGPYTWLVSGVFVAFAVICFVGAIATFIRAWRRK